MTEEQYKKLDDDSSLCTESEMGLFDNKKQLDYAFEWVRHECSLRGVTCATDIATTFYKSLKD